MLSDKPVVFSAKRISKDFGAGKTLKTAVKDVSFDIYDEEFISIVGGSGCGKSVLAKIMLGLYKPTRGQFLYRDKPIKNLKDHWNEVQSVFQDPFGCFNQFFTIRSQLEDALNILKDKIIGVFYIFNSGAAEYSPSNWISIDFKEEKDIPKPLTVEKTRYPDSLRLIIPDDGQAFDPLSHRDPDTTLCAGERDIGGLGILIVKKTMSPVTYRRRNGMNILSMGKVYGD